jgi:hypothetical protein
MVRERAIVKGCLKFGCVLSVIVLIGVAVVTGILFKRISDPRQRASILIINACRDKVLVSFDEHFVTREVEVAPGGRYVHFTLRGEDAKKVFGVKILRKTRKGTSIAKRFDVTYQPDKSEFRYTEDNRLVLENGQSAKGLVKQRK